MSTKIQINSLEALERLIGGDTELEIELRKTIVYAFVEKHLVKLVDDEKIVNLTDKINSSVNTVVAKKMDELFEKQGWGKYSWHKGFVPSDKLMKMLTSTIEDAVRTIMNPKIRAVIKERIDRALEYQLTVMETTLFKNTVHKGIERYVTQVLSSQIMPKLKKVFTYTEEENES